MRLIKSETILITSNLIMNTSKYKTLTFSASLFLLLFQSCQPYQQIGVTKSSQDAGSPQTLIYSLPKTRVDIDIEVTKTTIEAGPYSAYASKYLTITNAPDTDLEDFEITNVKITPVNEPDPDQFYALTFKTYPSNLEKLFSMTQQGLMLDLQNSWNALSRNFPSQNALSAIPFERSIYEPNITVNVDTLYKTILTDASFVKVPIYKKSVEIKNEEDKAKDMSDLILKLRKRRLKLMLGDYDYHPDGTAIKVIVDELAKQEQELMTLFIGKKTTQVTHYYYTQIPAGQQSKELTWFSSEKGILAGQQTGASAISISFNMKEAVASEPVARSADKTINSIIFRSPVIAQVNIKMGTVVLAEGRIPVYQAGKIMTLPVKP